MKLAFSRQIFEESSNIKFNQNPFSRSRFVPCVRTDGQTNMKKLIVAFRNFANAPKNLTIYNNVSVSGVEISARIPINLVEGIFCAERQNCVEPIVLKPTL
jgi:hypothetical protein